MNEFLASITSRQVQIGLWQALANPYTAEICAGAGYDWLLFDGEHAPNTQQTLLAQLQAVAPYPVEPVARVPVGEPWIIKQFLDIGFRTLLVPMVESSAQARALVAATRFPPRGIRGVASSTSRASRFGADIDYLKSIEGDICLLVQIENRPGLDAIEEIAEVEGVSGLFIGPSDLAASLGYIGEPRHSVVIAEVDNALERIGRTGRPSGIFALDAKDAQAKFAKGASFVSVGTDIGLLANSARKLRASFRSA